MSGYKTFEADGWECCTIDYGCDGGRPTMTRTSEDKSEMITIGIGTEDVFLSIDMLPEDGDDLDAEPADFMSVEIDGYTAENISVAIAELLIRNVQNISIDETLHAFNVLWSELNGGDGLTKEQNDQLESINPAILDDCEGWEIDDQSDYISLKNAIKLPALEFTDGTDRKWFLILDIEAKIVLLDQKVCTEGLLDDGLLEDTPEKSVKEWNLVNVEKAMLSLLKMNPSPMGHNPEGAKKALKKAWALGYCELKNPLVA